MPEHPLVEKMAQSIVEAFGTATWADVADNERVIWRLCAGAALKVVAEWEPSRDMLWCHEMPHIGPDEIRDCYRAMMSALKREAGLS